MKKRFSLIVVLSLLVSTLCACKAGKYGEDYTDVTWTSEDPQIEFTILDGRDCGFGVITVKEEKIDIFCQWFLNKKLVFFRVDDYPEDFDFYNDAMGGTGILSFSYKIKHNKATLKVLTDEVFDFQYDTIVLTYEKIE